MKQLHINQTINCTSIQVDFTHKLNLISGESVEGKTLVLKAINLYCHLNDIKNTYCDERISDLPEESIKSFCEGDDVIILNNADLYLTQSLLDHFSNLDVMIILSMNDTTDIRMDNISEYQVTHEFLSKNLEIKEVQADKRVEKKLLPVTIKPAEQPAGKGLTVYTSKEDIPSNLHYVDYNNLFFNQVPLTDDDKCKEILYAVDKALYHNKYSFTPTTGNYYNRNLNTESLSYGCKTLLNILNHPDNCFNVVECGSDALRQLHLLTDGNIMWKHPYLIIQYITEDRTCNINIDNQNFYSFNDFLNYCSKKAGASI